MKNTFKETEVNNIYSSRSKIYNFLLNLTGHTSAINYFIKNLPIEKDKSISILDAGCGTGSYSFSILKMFPNSYITALDFNEEMLEVFESQLLKSGMKERVRVLKADISKPLPEITEKFDLITGGVLEYVNMRETVKNLSKYLSLNGYFLNVAVRKNIFGQFSGKIWKLKPYSRKENIDVFRDNSFSLLNFFTYPFTKEAHLFSFNE